MTVDLKLELKAWSWSPELSLLFLNVTFFLLLLNFKLSSSSKRSQVSWILTSSKFGFVSVLLFWTLATACFAWKSETDLITVWRRIFILNQFGNKIFCLRNIYISGFWEKCAKFGGICRMYLVWQRKMDELKCLPGSKFNFHNWNRMLKEKVKMQRKIWIRILQR